MKSFKAKMYVEDGMATMEFDVYIPEIDDKVLTEEDNEKYAIDDDWEFSLVAIETTKNGPADYTILAIADNPTTIAEGERPKIRGTMTSVSMDGEFDTKQARYDTLKWIELYCERKLCVKYNFHPTDDSEYNFLNNKFVFHPQDSLLYGKIDVFLKQENGELRFVQWNDDDDWRSTVTYLAKLKLMARKIAQNDINYGDDVDDEEEYRKRMNK